MTEDNVQRFYEKEAKVYDETRFRSSPGAYVDSVQKSAVLELVGNCKGKRILEIGSGTGRFTRELAKRGAHVVCVDLSRKMHEHSSLFQSDNSVEYFVMSGSHLGFIDGTFDACLTINMMSHIEQESAIFAEVSRVLRKGGFFVANFPNMAGFYFPIGVIVNMFKRSLQAPVYSRWYSLRGVSKSLRCAELLPVHILWLMILPKTRCPLALFNFLRLLGNSLMYSNMRFLLGDLLVKSYRF